MSNFLAEMLGTMILVILGCGVNAGIALKKTFANGGGWLMGAIGWGLAVMIAIYSVGQISGAHINPAVTVGLAVAGEFDWSHVPTYIAGQMIGAIIGATLVYFQYLPHWKETDDAATKLGVFSTSPAVKHTPANLISEIIGTAILVLGLLAIGANSFADGLNPLIVGLLITSIGISLGGTTGYAINPARDLGPRIAHAILPIAGKGDSDWSYAWLPVVGPVIGGVVGAVVYITLW
ncbi:MAG: aquaporin family protein [Verrucomicrobia bacterium]|nr:aquaporin family protein [Verrucomicrobiota bacterium]